MSHEMKSNLIIDLSSLFFAFQALHQYKTYEQIQSRTVGNS